MALALTPGSEMRLDGAPDQMLPPQEDKIRAVAARLLEEDEEGVLYGGDIRNAIPNATQIVIEEDRARMAGSMAGAEATAAAPTGQRSTRAMEAEQAAYQGYADQEMAGLRALGPRAGEATQAADMRRNMDDMPYSMEPTGFAIDDEQTLREEYTRRFGRPPRTPEEVQLARNLLVDEAQERMRGAGTWGAQVPFESEEHRDAYRARTPQQYSQEQMDMMQVQGGGMGSPQGWVLVYHPGTGRLTPMQRAPDPTVTPDAGVSLSKEPAMDDEGLPVPGTSNRATNNRRVGPGVDRLDVQPELRNPQMEAEGYIPKLMDGPQGPEWVYEKDAATQAEARQDLNNWQERQRRQRLASRSGLSAADAAQQIAAQYEAEERPLSFEDRLRMQGDLARNDELRARRDTLREQRMLNAPGGAGLVNAINQLPPDWRNIAILDRITQGRVGGPTPLGVDAVGAQNAARFMNNSAFANNDPRLNELRRTQQTMAEQALPPEQAIGLSRSRGEPMGTGLSARHVGAAWVRSNGSEQWFRQTMEGWGYTPAEIDAWIDARMAAGDAPPPPARGPAVGPGSALPGSAGAAEAGWPGFSM